jgi:hypothetical protein
MADTVLSVTVAFVETHRFRFRPNATTSPSPDPTTWVPVLDPVRGAPKNKIVYVFMAVGNAPFQLLKACKVLSSGEIQEVSAADALKGNFTGGTFSETADLPLERPETQTRLPEQVQKVPLRYFFYVARHVVDGSFLIELAKNPRPELTIRTLDGLTENPAVIPVTDPLTIAEQLAIDYEKLRRAYANLCCTFAEQRVSERVETITHLKQRLIAEVLLSWFAQVGKAPSTNFAQEPGDFLRAERQAQSDADDERDIAAIECTLWFDGPLMTFARQTYFADRTSSEWTKDFGQLLVCDGSILSRLADSYRGASFIRTKITQNFYLMREFIGRPDGPTAGSLAAVQSVAKQHWDVVTKTWSAVGAIMAALQKPADRAPDPTTILTLPRMVTTYNTIFGEGLLTIVKTPGRPDFRWREGAQVLDVTLDAQLDSIVLKTTDQRIILLAKTPQTTKFPFQVPAFAKMITLINFLFGVSAAYEALRKKQGSRVALDDSFNALKLLGSMINTAASFPQTLSQFFRLTGRGLAFLSLAGTCLSLATGVKDTSDAYKRGDLDLALVTSIATLGGTLGIYGQLLFIAEVTGATAVQAIRLRALGLWGILIGAVTLAFSLLAKDSDQDLFINHCFLGKRFGEDTKQETWSPSSYELWKDDEPADPDDPNDPNNQTLGLDLQIEALYNLTFCFAVAENQSNTLGAAPHSQLVIDYGVYPPGATFEVEFSGDVQALAGGAPAPFLIDMEIDPMDQRFVRTTGGSLAQGSLSVSPQAQKIVIEGVPATVNPFADSVNNVVWKVRMNISVNELEPGATTRDIGYLTDLPSTVPASGNALVTNGGFLASLSTEIP